MLQAFPGTRESYFHRKQKWKRRSKLRKKLIDFFFLLFHAATMEWIAVICSWKRNKGDYLFLLIFKGFLKPFKKITTPGGITDESKGKLPARVVWHQDMSPRGPGAPPALQKSQNWMPKSPFIYLILCWWARRQQLLSQHHLQDFCLVQELPPHNTSLGTTLATPLAFKRSLKK